MWALIGWLAMFMAVGGFLVVCGYVVHLWRGVGTRPEHYEILA